MKAYSLFWIFIVMGFSVPVLGQKSSFLNIISADTLIGEQRPQGNLRRLIGNVKLRDDDLLMDADSAHHWVDRQELIGYGNVQILGKNQNVWADSVRYNTRTDIGTMLGRVVIETGSGFIYSQECIFDYNTEIAEFPTALRIEDDQGILIAQKGLFFTAIDSAALWNRVIAQDSTRYSEADSMRINEANEHYKLYGHVFIEDVKEKSRISGAYSERDSTGLQLIKGQAHFSQQDTAQADTTHIQADLIRRVKNDSTDIMQAFGSAQIWSNSYSAIADSMLFEQSVDSLYLMMGASLWAGQMQLSDSLLQLYLPNNELKSILAPQKPILVQLDSALNMHHQIQGESIQIIFTEGEIDSLMSVDLARIVYHSQENDTVNTILMDSDRITMWFEADSLIRVGGYKGIKGSVFENITPENQLRLDRFKWTPNLRPTKPETSPQPRFKGIPTELPFTPTPRFLNYIEQQK